MSIQAMSRVLASSNAVAMDRLVLLVMANRAGGDGDECFASVDRLAFECRIDTRTVQRAVKRLTVLGEVSFLGVHPRHRTNVYAVMPVGVAESHPPGAAGTPAPPELKELGVRGSSTASTSSHPTFGEWYGIYPRHMKPRTAAKAYREALKRTDADTLLRAVRRLAADPNLPPKDKIPYPATWLNADGWLDEPFPQRSSNGQGRRDKLAFLDDLEVADA